MAYGRDDDYEDEDNWRQSQYERDRYGQNREKPTDVGSALKDRVKAENGKLKVFGKEFDVGPQMAVLLSPVVNTAVNWVSLRGSSFARNAGTNIALNVMPPHHAEKVGKGLGLLWLYGLSLAEVGIGIKKTVSATMHDMNTLREQVAPLLAANNNMNVGLGNALTTKFGVVADARARVLATGKREFIGNLIGICRAVPTMLMGRVQTKLDNMVQQSGNRERLSENTTVGENDSNPFFAMFRFMSDSGFKDRYARVLGKPGAQQANQLDHLQVIRDLNSMPALADLATGFIERRVSGKEEKVLAWDKIMDLQEYISRHKQQPDKERIVVQVRDIFQQRARDMGRSYELEGSGFDKVTDAIADAIASGLHPQVLAEILDDRKIVTFDRRDADFGDVDEVNDRLTALKEKYSKRVSEKQFYINAAFTKETLPQIFKGVPDEEKPFFVMLFPPGILEKAGISKDEVKKYRQQSKDYFVDELTGVMQSMIDEGRKGLKQQGVRDKLIDRLEKFQDGIDRDGIQKHIDEATDLVRNIAASAKDQDAFWRSYLQKRGTEELSTSKPTESRTPMDHAERESGDDMGLDH